MSATRKIVARGMRKKRQLYELVPPAPYKRAGHLQGGLGLEVAIWREVANPHELPRSFVAHGS